MRVLKRTIGILLLICLSSQSLLIEASGDPAVVYYSTDEFEITDFDLKMYLREPYGRKSIVGSRARNLQALSDLYALRAIAYEVDSNALLSPAERAWLADHAVTMEIVNRHIARTVELQLAQTDWRSEALEKFMANPKEYQTPERVTVRTLLIEIGELSEADALELAEGLLAKARTPGADFAEIVRLNSHDAVGKKNGGLMKDIERGRTVRAFEDAAFGLREPGQFSNPVISQYGVHLIQLLDYQAAATPPFEDVEERIIDELKPVRSAEYRQAIQEQARLKTLPGHVEHTDALDDLISQTSDGSPGLN